MSRQVGQGILLGPEEALRLERIKSRQKVLDGLTVVAVSITAVWSAIIGFVGTYGYSWSPLTWVYPAGIIIVLTDVLIGWRRHTLRAERRRLRDGVCEFVLSNGALNKRKPGLRKLANDALQYCDTSDQAREVLAAYRDAALELMRLDGLAVPATSEALGPFEALHNELRRVRDEVKAKRERRLM